MSGAAEGDIVGAATTMDTSEPTALPDTESAEEAVDDPAEVSVSADGAVEEVPDQEGEAQQASDVWSAEDVGAEYGDDMPPAPSSGTDMFESEQDAATKPATRLPISKIKKIMKFDPEVTMANQDAVFLVAKATEMFIDGLVRHAGTCVTRGKRKTVQKRDIEFAVDSVNNFAFLEGVLETM